MDIGILHTHKTVIILFLLFYTVKMVLLLINSTTLLNNIRAKTKVVDMILGTLIIVTGGYLLFKGGHPANWLMIKFVIVLALIPAGIVALRKSNKFMSVLVFVGFLYIYRASETRSLMLTHTDYKSIEVKGEDDIVTAKTIYTSECARCHGVDGGAQLFGATNLQESKITQADAEVVISGGRKTMPAFGEKFTPEQIKVLAAYIQQFKNKNME